MKKIHHGDTEARSRSGQRSAISRQPGTDDQLPTVGLSLNPHPSPFTPQRFLITPYLRASVVNLLLWLTFMMLAVGCSPTPPAPQSANPPEPAMTHEEEHGILPHKPHSFEEAVSEIESRGRALIANSDKPPTQVTEWFDILGWLPELAADTELKRADWEQAVRIAKDFELWSDSWSPSSSGATAPDPARFESLIVELRQVLARIPPPR